MPDFGTAQASEQPKSPPYAPNSYTRDSRQRVTTALPMDGVISTGRAALLQSSSNEPGTGESSPMPALALRTGGAGQSVGAGQSGAHTPASSMALDKLREMAKALTRVETFLKAAQAAAQGLEGGIVVETIIGRATEEVTALKEKAGDETQSL